MAITLQESLRGLFYAPFYVALAREAYAAEGVTVRFASAATPGRAALGVLDGTADVCWGGPMRVMQAYAQVPDCDLVHFAEVVTRDPFLLIGRTPRPDFELRDLLGLRVGTVSEVPTPWMCLQEDLRRAGVAPARLNRVSDRSMADNVAALRRGELDVVQVFEPFAATLEADGGGNVWYAAARRGPTSYTTFYTRRGLLRDRREELLGMVRAIHRTLQWVAQADGAAIADAIAGFFPDVPPAAAGRRLLALQGAGHLGTRSGAAARRLRPFAVGPGVRRVRVARHAVRDGGGQQPGDRGGRGESAAAAIEIFGRETTMPHATADDGVRLYYEESGSGIPVIFVHEYAGDHRSWEPQMRHFGQRYRAITYAARGYPPSDVPEDVANYSQFRAADDIGAVLDHLKIDKAHVVGLSMGGFATLHFGFRHAARARSLVVAGCGYGAEPDQRDRFRAEAETIAEFIATQGIPVFAEKYAYGPTRVQFENKDPRGFAEFKAQLAEHSALGARNTQLGVQRERPSLYELVDQMKALTVPTLVLTGDEDWPCLAPGILMKQHIPSAALAVMPNCGHAINIEDPDEFNRLVGGFLAQVDAGRWPTRDPRAVTASITGMK